MSTHTDCHYECALSIKRELLQIFVWIFSLFFSFHNGNANKNAQDRKCCIIVVVAASNSHTFAAKFCYTIRLFFSLLQIGRHQMTYQFDAVCIQFHSCASVLRIRRAFHSRRFYHFRTRNHTTKNREISRWKRKRKDFNKLPIKHTYEATQSKSIRFELSSIHRYVIYIFRCKYNLCEHKRSIFLHIDFIQW